MKYLVLIEKSTTGYSAYSPDVDGCVAAAKSKRAVERSMRTALELHLEAMHADGLRVPPPQTTSTYVEV